MSCVVSQHYFITPQVVNEALSVGASLLLPPLPERMDVLHSLLPQAPDSWDNLTRGEVSVTS